MKNKYLKHSSRNKNNLVISDILMGKYIDNISYRKRNRFSICMYLYKNKIIPKEFMKDMSIDGLRVLGFYFNVFMIESMSKIDYIEILNIVLNRKIRQFHSRFVTFKKDDTLTIQEILNLVKRKI